MAGPLELFALDLLAEITTKTANDVRKLSRALTNLKETIMAEFDGLNQALDTQGEAISAAVQRVADDVQALQDRIAELELDTTDQAAVDAATARVNESIAALQNLDPVADAPAEPEQPAQPEA